MARTSEQLTATEVVWVEQGSAGDLRLLETTAPNTLAGYGQIYVKSSDHLLYFKNASGVESAIDISGATGTVTSVSVATANGFSGTVANATTTPAITIIAGAITPTTVNGLTLSALATGFTVAGGTTSKTLTVPLDASVSGTNTGDQTNITGNAGTVTVADAGGDTTTWVLLGTSQTGSLAPATDGTLTYNATTHALTTTTFIGALTGNASTATSATSATTATNATNTAITDDTTTNATMYPTWVTAATGNLPQKVSSTKLTFNPSTAVLTTTTFAGALSGNATSATSATTATTATNATNTAITDDTTTNATMYPTWVTTASSNQAQKVSSTKLSFNPSTGALTSTNFVGTFAGNTFTTGTGVLTIAASKTLTVSNTITLAGTDSTTMTFPTTNATIARTDAANTFTGIQTITNMTLPSNGQILHTVPTADPSATGPTTSSFNSGYTSTAIGDLMYLDSSATWQKTDADAASTASNMLGIALSVASSGNPVLVALPGSFIYATAFITFTVGAPVYVGETAGSMQTSIPTGADNVIRVIGFGIHADKIFFNPSSDNQTTVA